MAATGDAPDYQSAKLPGMGWRFGAQQIHATVATAIIDSMPIKCESGRRNENGIARRNGHDPHRQFRA